MARILIIEDDAGVRSGLRRTLERLGHVVDEAPHGAAGVAAFDRAAHDLVITDINMPEMDGIEVILTLVREAPNVPVIAMSAGGRVPKELLLENADLLGAVDTLPKPFTLEELRAALDRVLEAHA